ncbi:PREDICTED: uncharacterized protein C8orf58 homolog [Nipponia nippon]|uniref:uncharacterized protein C8orf58 homolog n=1 Tax=Nipponia nippon TaxID=128390 RepID=UPI000510966F|nr:PREDICTED: uncharacterized protein C8orf58 homolog [Nipponia nippon]
MASNEHSPSTPLGSESSFSLDGFPPEKSSPGEEPGTEPPRPPRSCSASKKLVQAAQRSKRQRVPGRCPRQLGRHSTSAADLRAEPVWDPRDPEEPSVEDAEGSVRAGEGVAAARGARLPGSPRGPARPQAVPEAVLPVPGQGLRYLEHVCQMLERLARLQQDNQLLRQQAADARRTRLDTAPTREPSRQDPAVWRGERFRPRSCSDSHAPAPDPGPCQRTWGHSASSPSLLDPSESGAGAATPDKVEAGGRRGEAGRGPAAAYPETPGTAPTRGTPGQQQGILGARRLLQPHRIPLLLPWKAPSVTPGRCYSSVRLPRGFSHLWLDAFPPPAPSPAVPSRIPVADPEEDAEAALDDADSAFRAEAMAPVPLDHLEQGKAPEHPTKQTEVRTQACAGLGSAASFPAAGKVQLPAFCWDSDSWATPECHSPPCRRVWFAECRYRWEVVVIFLLDFGQDSLEEWEASCQPKAEKGPSLPPLPEEKPAMVKLCCVAVMVAEFFQEMLEWDFGYKHYKTLLALPGKEEPLETRNLEPRKGCRNGRGGAFVYFHGYLEELLGNLPLLPPALAQVSHKVTVLNLGKQLEKAEQPALPGEQNPHVEVKLD